MVHLMLLLLLLHLQTTFSQHRERRSLIVRMLKSLLGACANFAERQYQFELHMTEHIRRIDSRTRQLWDQAHIPVSPLREDVFVVPPP